MKLPPFPATSELSTKAATTQFLKTQTGLNLAPDLARAEIEAFLCKELETAVLDELYPHLWLVAKKSSTHIDALHVHKIKKRNIVLAEDPALHLVWYYDTVYLKPIPPYLVNHHFWETHLLPAATQPNTQSNFNVEDLSQNCRSALGFLKSYSYLVSHNSDFEIAQKAKLIQGDISYQGFQDLMKGLRCIPNDALSPRYQYGQMRLTRLNWAVRLCRPRSTGRCFPWTYQERYWQTGDYLERFVAPILFVFAVISVALSAMQVVLAASGTETCESCVQASWGFSVAVLLLTASIIATGLLGVVATLLIQAQFAVRMHWRDVFGNRNQVPRV